MFAAFADHRVARRRSACPGPTGSSASSWCCSAASAGSRSATGIATTGVIFAAAYLLWALQRIIFNPLDKPENEALHRSRRRASWPCWCRSSSASSGWASIPQPVLRRMEAAARRYVETVRPLPCPAQHDAPTAGESPLMPLDLRSPLRRRPSRCCPSCCSPAWSLVVLLVVAWRHGTDGRQPAGRLAVGGRRPRRGGGHALALAVGRGSARACRT